MTTLASAATGPWRSARRRGWASTTAGLAVVEDEPIERMMALGLMAAPGLGIDEKGVMSGRIPRTEEVRHLLGAA